MTSKLNDSQLNTIEQIEKFLNHSDGLTLVRMDKEESYKWIKATLRAHNNILTVAVRIRT